MNKSYGWNWWNQVAELVQDSMLGSLGLGVGLFFHSAELAEKPAQPKFFLKIMG